MADLPPGTVIALPDGRRAVIQFAGITSFAPGDWLGIRLDEPTGKNDGSVQGERYFDCEPGHGMFIRPTAVAAILEMAPPPAPSAHHNRLRQGTRPPPSATGNVSRGSTTRNSLSGIPSTSSLARHTSSVRRPSSISNLASPAKSPSRPSESNQEKSPTKPRTAIISRTGMPTPSAMGAPSMRLPKQPSSSTIAKQPSSSTLTPRNSAGQLASSRLTPASAAKRGSLSRTPGSSPGASDDVHSSSEKGKDFSDGDSSSSILGKRALRSRPSLSSGPRTALNANALTKELEDLRTKLRMLEKKRAEDREKLKDMENLQADKEKYEGIITKLQAKYQPQALELNNLRKAMKELEAKYEESERLQAEHDSILEMATLDREMAEETAEAIKMEFDALKLKAEELELEVEVLREENKELGSGMSPEEKSSAGWLQLEKTNERLREALIRLRDMTQQQEIDLKKQVQELEADLEDYSALKSNYEVTKEQLRVSEANMEDLKQQVEALGAEDMIEELTEKNMQYQEQVTELKAVIEDLENLRELNDELEVNHMETEKQMQEEIDFLERLYNEQRRKVVQQNETISDLEYTLNRFRELVSTLQNDLEDMRVTQQLTESEANDLTVRSRAMIDLNMKLQSSISKAQTKTIDIELSRMEAEEAEQHLEIMKLYLPEYYETEKNPVLAFLRFKRVSFKAQLMNDTVKERMSDSTVALSAQDIFVSFDLVERLTLISALCKRFMNFMSSCSGEEFLRFEGAWYELEPVERNLNHYIDGLKKNEINEKICSIELQRSTALLLHLSETLIQPTMQMHANETSDRSIMIQTYLDNTASALSHLRTTIVKKVPAIEGDEDGPFLLQKLDSLAAHARGGKVVAGRTTRALEELKARLLTPPKGCAEVFEKSEDITRSMAEFSRAVGVTVVELLEDAERMEPPSSSEIIDCMNKAVPAGSSSTEEAAPYITKQLQIISTNLEGLSTIATDLSQTVEFERQQSPWVKRSKELKSNKVVPPDADEEICRLRNAVHEAGTALGVKDKNIEEQTIKIELLESRMRDSTKKAEMLKDVQAELEKMKTEREELVQITEKQSNDLNSLEQEREDFKLRLEKAKRVSTSTDILSGAALPVSEIASSELVRENDHLRSEIANLQAAIRHTREENRRANMLDPCAVQRINNVRSWLDAPLVKPPQSSVEEELQQATVNQCHDVFSHLLLLTSQTSLVDLKKTVPVDQSSRLAWRPLKTTTKYQTAKQRDDYESWFAWKEDVARRERERARRLETIKIGRLRKNTEPPTLYQVYSDAHFSSSLHKKDVPYDPAQAIMDRAFGFLAKTQKRDVDDDTIARPFTGIDIVKS